MATITSASIDVVDIVVVDIVVVDVVRQRSGASSGTPVVWHPCRDAEIVGDGNRWCRYAQPPATGCEASGFTRKAAGEISGKWHANEFSAKWDADEFSANEFSAKWDADEFSGKQGADQEFFPGGKTDISRWLSEATPPEKTHKLLSTPAGVADAGRGHTPRPSFAQPSAPPANIFFPSGKNRRGTAGHSLFVRFLSLFAAAIDFPAA